jgi:hypothetical protein
MLVSPDACLFAYYDLNAVLHLSPLDADRWSDYRADLGTFATFSANIRSARAFAWATNSRFLWTATHDVIRPSGFATSPMRPVQTGENGTFQALPELRHDSGPLDALLWVGSEGLAAVRYARRILPAGSRRSGAHLRARRRAARAGAVQLRVTRYLDHRGS